MRRFYFTFYLLFLSAAAFTQLRPVGEWQSYQVLRKAIQLAPANEILYCATQNGLFGINKNDYSVVRYSKVNGMSESSLSAIGYDPSSNILAIGYTNSNLDLLQNNRITGVPDLKLWSGITNKTIYEILFFNNKAYLATGLGIIIVNPNGTVSNTWYIGDNGSPIKIQSLTANQQYFFAASASGLKKAQINNPSLFNYTSWETIPEIGGMPSSEIRKLVSVGNSQTTSVLALINDEVYIERNNSWEKFFGNGNPLINISAVDHELMIAEKQTSGVKLHYFTTDGTLRITLSAPETLNAITDAAEWDGSIWITDAENGLFRYSDNSWTNFTPDGPFDIPAGEIKGYPGNIYFAGGTRSTPYNTGYISLLQSGQWVNFTSELIPALDSLQDIRTVCFDYLSGSLFAGSYGGGLIEIKQNGSAETVKNENFLRVGGTVIDRDGNLWVSAAGNSPKLWVRKKDGIWLNFDIPSGSPGGDISHLIIDQQNQKWLILPQTGLICFNHGTSIDNPGDDKWKLYIHGSGNGNLPHNEVLSMVTDKSGFVWVGTENGIGIIQCAAEVFSSRGCEAYLPIVQQDNFFGFLFQNERVNSIAVDGGNRKWVGTENGLWLLSADGDKIIYRFTTENSPLPSDKVKSIGIEPETGEVFISTSEGLVSFRGTATEGKPEHHHLQVFPNPVPPDFTGLIAIRGLTTNAHVKIVEQNGKLVYQTRATGGQAIWNGRDYKGNKVASGVYLVLVSDESGKQTSSGKIVFVRGK